MSSPMLGRIESRTAVASLLSCLCWSLLACGGTSDGGGNAAAGAGAQPAAGGSSAGASSSGAGAGNAGAPATGNGGAATAGSSGSAQAGQPSGGAAPGGAGGSAGADVGGAANTGGNAGTAGGGGAAAAFPDPSTFVCNAMYGVSVTGDWYGAGFETGLSGDHWQLRWKSLAFVEQWADPKDAIWSEPLISPCANGSTNPDRVIFTGVNWTYTTEAEWETQLTGVVETLKAKYSALKEIDLMTMLRAPGNKVCGDPAVTATREQVVAPYIDQAISAVVAKYPTLVRAAPPFYAPDCAIFLPNSPHFADGKAPLIAKLMRDYYVNH